MIQLIAKERAEEILVNYIDVLDKTGYVKAGTVKRILAYTFLLDFVEYMHAFITEKDYKIIDKALHKLFSSGGCLLPYPVFCVRRATLGDADYMGDYIVRITEVEEDDRISEMGDIRTV